MTVMGRAVYLYLKGLWWGKVAEPMGRESDRTGWAESQQVVEGGGIYKAPPPTHTHTYSFTFSFNCSGQTVPSLPSLACERFYRTRTVKTEGKR
jgi:hypothetical protein